MPSALQSLVRVALALALASPVGARTVLDLQPTVQAQRAKLGKSGLVRLVRPNPRLEDWYLLEVRWPGAKTGEWFHLENSDPKALRVRLLDGGSPELALDRPGKKRVKCAPWGKARAPSPLGKGRRARKPFVPLCGGELFLRNQTFGDRTTVEWAVDFLRKRAPLGEDLINLVKDTVYKDASMISTKLGRQLAAKAKAKALALGKGPVEAAVGKALRDTYVRPKELGIRLAGGVDRLTVGKWYRSALSPHAYVSAYLPEAVPETILRTDRDRASGLDRVERRALVYLIAFDLGAHDVGYALGTENPELAYSERTAPRLRRKGWLGPDGVRSAFPFASTGLVNPKEAERIAAVFTGGFKRKHSVFRTGALAQRNGGTHYGFLQRGVVFSSLWPGLATATVDASGRFSLGTWSEADTARTAELRFARQNGLPLVEWDAAAKRPVVGELVAQNFAGNWSGDKLNQIRTLRSGMCWQQSEDGREHLVYAYFSSHTPSAMARVFQAYGCRYAMHLDMNMVRHVYMALHGRRRSEYLVKEMASRDVFLKNDRLPRFVGAPDNRDFFYLTYK
jgi:hypothetical protein